uniref:Trihydroxynaphthalene reductase ) n=1 Tax=Ganoderma boninense TaxID=34458 RepID=A0A5K1K615_9APHY|nr:Trihydroxynaphthalene reductase (EC (T3HN reductase) [Ganoderma boninense]
MSSARRINFTVTGASSGFGLEMARCALAHGDRVVATLRRPEVLNEFAAQYTPKQLLVLRLDVSKPDEIKDAFAKAKTTFGRIDVVFNNAGYAFAGEVEAVPDEPARALFDVIFWGAAHVSQEAVRFFRDENSPRGGRLIQNSATVGLAAVPAMGFYGAAKHALEGLTETLSMELDPSWNIKISPISGISSVLPGGFVTEIFQKLEMLPQHPAYASDATTPATLMRKHFSDGVDKEAMKARWSDPAKGVQKIYELSQLPDPPLRLLLGKDANQYVAEYLAKVTKEVELYASWSDDLRYEPE